MPNVTGELRYKVEVLDLMRKGLCEPGGEGTCQWLVVCVDRKLAVFYHMSEVQDGKINGQ